MFTTGHIPAHKGQRTTTDPIKDVGIVRQIAHSLAGRDLALWSVAVNSALRAGDLCDLTWEDTEDDGTTITLRLLEGKTSKFRQIPLNPTTSTYLRAWRKECDSQYIYSGQRGQMTTATWSRMVKGWCFDAGLKGNFSGHTTRKTWARIQHEHFGTSMATLMSALNHSTEKQTLVYIGKLSDDVTAAYAKEL